MQQWGSCGSCLTRGAPPTVVAHHTSVPISADEAMREFEIQQDEIDREIEYARIARASGGSEQPFDIPD
jgi:hypothetical protein